MHSKFPTLVATRNMAFKQARRVGERLAKLDSCAANEVTFFAKSEFILQTCFLPIKILLCSHQKPQWVITITTTYVTALSESQIARVNIVTNHKKWLRLFLGKQYDTIVLGKKRIEDRLSPHSISTDFEFWRVEHCQCPQTMLLIRLEEIINKNYCQMAGESVSSVNSEYKCPEILPRKETLKGNQDKKVRQLSAAYQGHCRINIPNNENAGIGTSHNTKSNNRFFNSTVRKMLLDRKRGIWFTIETNQHASGKSLATVEGSCLKAYPHRTSDAGGLREVPLFSDAIQADRRRKGIGQFIRAGSRLQLTGVLSGKTATRSRLLCTRMRTLAVESQSKVRNEEKETAAGSLSHLEEQGCSKQEPGLNISQQEFELRRRKFQSVTLLDNTTYQLQHILKATGQQGNTKAEASEEVVEEILREPVAESQTESKFQDIFVEGQKRGNGDLDKSQGTLCQSVYQ